MSRIDPSHALPAVHGKGPEEDLSRGAVGRSGGDSHGAKRPVARHNHPLPFAPSAGASAAPAPRKGGSPPLPLHGSGAIPSCSEILRMLLEMKMSAAMRALLFPEPRRENEE